MYTTVNTWDWIELNWPWNCGQWKSDQSAGQCSNETERGFSNKLTSDRLWRRILRSDRISNVRPTSPKVKGQLSDCILADISADVEPTLVRFVLVEAIHVHYQMGVGPRGDISHKTGSWVYSNGLWHREIHKTMYSLSSVILVDEKLTLFHQYLRYSHKCDTIVFSIPGTILWV